MQHGEELIRGSEDFLRNSEIVLQGDETLLQNIRMLKGKKNAHFGKDEEYDALIQKDEAPMQATLQETYEE
eukprot:14839873-Alexandrium_andersonii.AAC.1